MSIINAALYIVATPIGNLADITMRALDTLRQVDLIAAEDTRHSRVLLDHYNIRTPCISFHEHNEQEAAGRVIQHIIDGQAVALISDAGTPLISDPGYQLVNAALGQGIRIVPVPGPSAVICALSVAGQPTDRFTFEGYLPSRHAARRRRLEALAGEERTMVFFEAPHRIAACLGDMVQVFGPRRGATYSRELTKKYETVRRAALGELLQLVQDEPRQQKGEIVLVVQGQSPAERSATEAQLEHLLTVLLRHVSVKTAVAIAAEISGGKKNLLYRKAVELSGPGD